MSDAQTDNALTEDALLTVGNTYRYLVYPHDRWFTAILEWNEDEEDYVLQTYGEDAEYWGDDATYCEVCYADTIEEVA